MSFSWSILKLFKYKMKISIFDRMHIYLNPFTHVYTCMCVCKCVSGVLYKLDETSDVKVHPSNFRHNHN